MKRTKRSFKFLALLLLLGLSVSGCGKKAEAEKHEKQLFAMDTVMFLTAYGEEGDNALLIASDLINNLASDLDPEEEGSSVYTLNHSHGKPVEVSADCLSVLKTALEVWKSTGGALDPALYPLIRTWGFTTGDYHVPEPSEIDALLEEKKTDAIVFDNTTAKLPENTMVSFGALAKGYAAQKAADAMAKEGVTEAILSLGGNVQTLGSTRPDGKAWQVAVTDPRNTGNYVGTLSVGQTAVVTSGGYQRFFEQDGKTYIHILDPSTGAPVNNDLLSVTVVTPDGCLADALSTALFVMGEEDALNYCSRCEQVECVLITRDNRVVVTEGLADVFTESSENYTYEYPAAFSS